MAGPQFLFSKQLLSRGPVRDHPLVDSSEGGTLTSPSPALLPSQRDGEPILDPLFGLRGTPISRTTFDSDLSFNLLTQQSSVLSHANSPPTRSRLVEADRDIIQRKPNFRAYFWAVFCLIYTFGTYRIFSARFRFEGGSQSSPEIIYQSSYAQWVKAIQRMSSVWRLARVGCGLLLPLSIALLQLGDVSQTVFIRTCTITTAIFAAAGLLSSGSYLFLRSELKNQRTRIKWVEASRRSAAMESIEFWTFLALPLTSLLWAILSCAFTIICLAWTKQNGVFMESDTSYIGGGVFISALTVITLIHLYKAAQLLDWA